MLTPVPASQPSHMYCCVCHEGVQTVDSAPAPTRPALYPMSPTIAAPSFQSSCVFVTPAPKSAPPTAPQPAPLAMNPRLRGSGFSHSPKKNPPTPPPVEKSHVA